MSLKDEVLASQRTAIEEALKRTGGNAAHAARLLAKWGAASRAIPEGHSGR